MTDHFEPHRTLSHPKARVYKNRGVVIELAASYEELEAQSLAAIEPLWAKYPKTQAFWQTLLDDPEARSNWDITQKNPFHPAALCKISPKHVPRPTLRILSVLGSEEGPRVQGIQRLKCG